MENLITFNVTYTGKRYEIYDDGQLDVAKGNAVTSDILKRIEHLAPEIKKEDGSLTINYNEDFQPTITLHDMSPALREKIYEILHEQEGIVFTSEFP